MKAKRTGPRILFLQLPLVDPLSASAGANIPLAGGYLASAIARSGLDAECLFPDATTVNYGCDAELLRAILSAAPDIIACSCYMWNVERSLAIGAKAKAALPGCELWLGGPEIQRDLPWTADRVSDRLFIGEGEDAMVEALRERALGRVGERVVIGRTADVSAMGNPFAEGILEKGPLDQALVETMRGCRSRCRYCYYGKAQARLRAFPDERIGEFFSWARASGVREIYMMDPSLEQRPDFDALLGKLAAWNPAGAGSPPIPLHAELSAESLSPARAESLAACGLQSVEVGLQTVNARALKTASRAFNRQRFISGAEALNDKGIEVRTGIILGLPDDDLSGFQRTLEFVAQAGLAEAAEVYPLSVLPGTDFRAEAPAYGLGHLAVPPYTVTASRGWKEGDFARAQDLVEDILGKGLYAAILPRFLPPLGGLNRSASLSQIADGEFRLASSLSVLVSPEALRDTNLQKAASHRFRTDNPHGCLQLVISAPGDIDREALELSDLFFDPAHYLERFHLHDADPQGRFSVRCFQSSPDPADIMRLMDSDAFCDPLYLIEAGTKPDVELLREWRPSLSGSREAFMKWAELLTREWEGTEEMKVELRNQGR